MKQLLALKRKLYLYNQIHKFNVFDLSVFNKTWHNNIINMLNSNMSTKEKAIKYYNVNDELLQIFSMPLSYFYKILHISCLFLCFSNPSTMMSGKHLQALLKLFTKNEFAIAKKQIQELKTICINNKNMNSDNLIDVSLLKSHIIDYMGYSLLEMLIQKENIIFQSRFNYKFNKNITQLLEFNEVSMLKDYLNYFSKKELYNIFMLVKSIILSTLPKLEADSLAS